MNRRQYLKIVGLGIGVLSGCIGDDPESSPTPSPTATSSPTSTASPSPSPTLTPTPTPEAQRPEIVEASLLYLWQAFGDVLSKQIDAVGKGAQAVIGFRHVTEVHDGTYDVTEQVRIFGPDGNRIDQQSFDDEQLVEGVGPQEWEHALYFDTSTWDKGQHDFEVLIRDNVSGKISESAQGSFRVNSPLGPNEAGLEDVEASDTVTVGKDYSFTLTLENLSSRDGSVVTSLSAKYRSEPSWYTYPDLTISSTIPSGGTNTWESTSVSFDDTGTVQFRLDEINEVWEVEVTSN